MATIPRMIPTQRLPASLTPLETAVAALLDRLQPVKPIALALAEALACVAADMPPLNAFPPHDVAARTRPRTRSGASTRPERCSRC